MPIERNLATATAGDTMVVVKVRETYDLKTQPNKMSVIGIRTPKASILQNTYPGLLMNCKFVRPLSADVVISCASMLPADPLQVGVADGDIAPEDLFNPILYKACTNESFALLESSVLAALHGKGTPDVDGQTAIIDTTMEMPTSSTAKASDFDVYYGLLADTHSWRHANPQAGMQMRNLRPLVHEVLQDFAGTMSGAQGNASADSGPYLPNPATGQTANSVVSMFTMRGNAKPMPRVPCTQYTNGMTTGDFVPGFNVSVKNIQSDMSPIENFKILCGCIIIPPSRLHSLYYRMVVEWTVEFSELRPMQEISNWNGVAIYGSQIVHRTNYNYTASAKASGINSVLDNDVAMATANVELDKVM
nr:MAG: capsid protein [Smacoviridae sp.]